MIRINLLPPGLEAPSAPINPAFPMGIALAVPVIGFSLFHTLSLKPRHARLQAKIAEKKSDLDKLQAIIRQVQDLESAKAQLNSRKTVIQSLEVERLRYPRFMEDCVRLLPGNVWITNMTAIQQPSGGAMSITLNVSALDNYAVADLIANLENSQVFTDIELDPITASANAQTGGQTMTFTVRALYNKTETMPDAPKKS